MICTQCGREIPDQAVICGYCGTLVAQPDSASVPPNPAPQPNPVYTRPNAEQQPSPAYTQPNIGPQPGPVNIQPNVQQQPYMTSQPNVMGNQPQQMPYQQSSYQQMPYQQSPYQQMPYQPNPYHTIPNYNPNMENGSSGLAVASMVLGIISLLLSCCIPSISLITLIIGLILGIIALVQGKGGRGMAVAGVACCAAAFLFAIIGFAFSYELWNDILYW